MFTLVAPTCRPPLGNSTNTRRRGGILLFGHFWNGIKISSCRRGYVGNIWCTSFFVFMACGTFGFRFYFYQVRSEICWPGTRFWRNFGRICLLRNYAMRFLLSVIIIFRFMNIFSKFYWVTCVYWWYSWIFIAINNFVGRIINLILLWRFYSIICDFIIFRCMLAII